jgi:hypothetical protein
LVINTGKEMRRYGKTPHYFLSAKTANTSSADSSIIQREKCYSWKDESLSDLRLKSVTNEP